MSRPHLRTATIALIVSVALAASAACFPDPELDPETLETLADLVENVPEELKAGKAHFEASCASCHGDMAEGSTVGPPLVHRVYRPGHHGDAAFMLAVERGVTAHHWGFGSMPPMPDIERSDVEAMTAYVRWLQRGAGIE